MAEHDEDFGAINTLLGNVREKAMELRETLSELLPQEALQNSGPGDLLHAINTHLENINKAYFTLRKTHDRNIDQQVTSAANMGTMWMDAYERQALRGVKASRNTNYPEGQEKTYQQSASAVIHSLSQINHMAHSYEELAKVDEKPVIQNEALLMQKLNDYKTTYEEMNRAMMKLSIEQQGLVFPPPINATTAMQHSEGWSARFQPKQPSNAPTPIGRT